MDDRIRTKRWSSALIPVQYRDLRLSDLEYEHESVDSQAFDSARSYVENFDKVIGASATRKTAGKGMCFIGKPGIGKTELACAVLQEIHLIHAVNVLFVPMADYISKMIEQIKWSNRKGDPDADERFWAVQGLLDRVNDTQLILLSDVGKEHKTNSGFAEDEFDRLIRSRYSKGLPTIMESNLPINSWAGSYGDAMESFIHQACHIIDMRGRDHRK